MKSKLFVLIFGIIAFFNQAQDYQISFTATGAETDIDSVKVENLTQCTSISILGDDILNLVNELGIGNVVESRNSALSIFPNPFINFCNIEFETPVSVNAIIEISDMTGKIVTRIQNDLQKGKNSFRLSGLSIGVYLIQIKSESFTCSGKIICTSEEAGIPEIKLQSTKIDGSESQKIKTVKNSNNLKNTTSVVQMQYNSGDIIKLTGISGIYRTVFMIVPTSSQTVNFTFIPCTDSDGNNYTIVQIGNQWWMAENLNAGTYVPVTSPQVSGTKFCMDVYGQADPDCPMGGLYEWSNLMQGSAPCNGSGAPPNDKCSTPVKGLCPNGWHIPSHYEWTTLERNAGSNPSAFPYNESTISLLGTDEGGNLKETCTSFWWAPNTGATNLTGFSALPGGDTWNGVFEDFGQSAYFWTTTETFFMSWVHALNYSLTVVGRSSYAVESGFSCRCVKD
ncbi:MAG: hypothetical protein A2W91_05400 [Bacteroidetes bacterium GWF2_38_335]|nr:MAG: hypothetical protein A2W91_05400 [Bacteroidetes bacterium GWF2_38_335]